MATLSEKNEKILKIIHIASMAIWTASLFIMFAIDLILLNAPSSEAFYFAHHINYIIDFIILTPAAIITFLTGLIYALFTKWKIKENTWLRIKAIITVLIIVLGTFWLGPLLREMAGNAKEAGLDLLTDNNYLIDWKIVTWFSIINGVLLLVTIALSTLKPGGKTQE